MSLTVHARGVTDIGRKRKRNEDSLLVVPELGLFAVADGMGGAAAGEVASQRAVEVVRVFVTERAQVLRDFAADPTPDRGAAAARLVEQAIQAACNEIYRMAGADVRLRGMGTTFVALAIAGDRGVVAHVGDSRLYLARRGHAHVLTEDHTLIASQIKAGEIRPEDAERSPFKGVLTRALGQHESVQVDTLVVDLLPGDAFLLCSDGLHGYFGEEELAQRFAEGVNDSLAADLVTLANERGGRDNITAIVVSVTDSGAEEPASMARIDALRRIPLFEHLTYREQNEVLAIARTRTYPTGATIVREGEPGGDLFVVLDGEVSIEQSGLPIATVGAGGHFGEMGLVDAGPRSASVRAATPMRAMVIQREEMLGVMQREPTLAVKLLWAFVQVLSHRLRVANSELSGALAGPETTRL
ncbi:MAG: protein phosphatase 2C domain-containing protein [Minicystis sp.]